MKWKSILYFLLLLTSIVSAQVKYVPSDYTMIQHAINDSKDGDTIIVEEGTYTQQINFKGKAITVGSRYVLDGMKSHIENTIIDGMFLGDKDSCSLVYLNSGEDSTSVLSGLTLQNGKGTHWVDKEGYIHAFGGAISLDRSGGTIADNIIKDNTAITEGRYADWSGAWGGGIDCIQLPYNKTLLITNNRILNNLTHSISAQAMGGSISITWTYGNVKISKNEIRENELRSIRSGYGGGIAVVGAHDNAKVIIDNNYISDNSTYSKGGASKGGGIACYFSAPVIRNNIIVYNSTNYPTGSPKNACGGGISVHWYLQFWQSDFSICENPHGLIAIIENNTIAYNNDKLAGGGLAFRNVGARLRNNIIGCNFAENDPQIKIEYPDVPETESRTIKLEYCNIQGGYDGEGNVNKFPEFTDEKHWYLKRDLSPCIDSGNPENKYDDIEDPNELGQAYFPALGGLRNDIGAFGGPHSNWSEEILTDIMNEQLSLPPKIELSQNYPNPFNPITTIKYQIPLEVKSQKSKVKNVVLKIFDILGRDIATLVNAKQGPGNYEITWDASNQTSGIYFYNLQTDNFTKTKKMILLK